MKANLVEPGGPVVAIYQNTLDALTAERDQLRALLWEAVDSLCPHTQAVESWRKFDRPCRVWCCDCSEYIRNDADATLKARIIEALESK